MKNIYLSIKSLAKISRFKALVVSNKKSHNKTRKNLLNKLIKYKQINLYKNKKSYLKMSN